MSTNYAYISTGNNALRLSKSKEDSPKEKTQKRKKRERVEEEEEQEEVSSDGNVSIPAKRKKNRLEKGVEDFFCGLNTCFFCCCVAATKMQAPTQHKSIATTDEIDERNAEKSAVAVREESSKLNERERERERERLGFRTKS